MTPAELLKYLETHRGEATIGTPQSLESAKALSAKALVAQIGSKNGMPIIELTPRGAEFLKYAKKKMGGKSDMVKSGLKGLGGLVQDYATAFKGEHSIGVFSEMGMGGGSTMGSTDLFSMGDLSMIPAEPSKVLAKKKNKALPKEINVGGAKYKLET